MMLPISALQVLVVGFVLGCPEGLKVWGDWL
jgi:hypothetical protein